MLRAFELSEQRPTSLAVRSRSSGWDGRATDEIYDALKEKKVKTEGVEGSEGTIRRRHLPRHYAPQR